MWSAEGRSCCNDVYKVEKSKEDRWEPGNYAAAVFLWLPKNFYGPKIIGISVAKGILL